MKKSHFTRINLILVLFSIFIFTQTSRVLAAVQQYGAQRGQWTMDLEAAKALASKENLPLFLNFTGSDWCGWCKIMDRQVFRQKEWKKFAQKHLILVTIDFPRNSSLVPAKYKERNQKLQMQYRVPGYPTYILLNPDGKTELSRLGAASNINASSFNDEILRILRKSKSYVQRISQELSAEKVQSYHDAIKMLQGKHKEFEDWLKSSPKETEENHKVFLNFQGEILSQTSIIERIEAESYVKKDFSDRAQEYLALVDKKAKVQAELHAWLQTNPAGEKADNDALGKFEKKISELTEKLYSY